MQPEKIGELSHAYEIIRKSPVTSVIHRLIQPFFCSQLRRKSFKMTGLGNALNQIKLG
jgi:hypothetical protein